MMQVANMIGVLLVVQEESSSCGKRDVGAERRRNFEKYE